jgi:hypothetical protein
MPFLTDRTQIVNIGFNNFVHVVDPLDISQGNPDGSSYKTDLQQIYDLFAPSLTAITRNYTTTGITISVSSIDENYIYNGINYIGDVDLTIPDPTGVDGLFLIIKDEAGNAGTNRIRLTPVLGTIDGNPFVDMNINYMSLTIMARNNNWWII